MSDSQVLSDQPSKPANAVPAKPVPVAGKPPVATPATPVAAAPTKPPAAKPRPVQAQPAQTPTDPAQPGDDAEPEAAPRRSWGAIAQLGSAYMVSVLLHGAVLLVMWFWVLPADVREEILTVLVREKEPVEDVEIEDVPLDQPLELTETIAPESPSETPLLAEVEDTVESPLNIDDQLEAVLDSDVFDATGPPAKVGDASHGVSRGSLMGDRFARGANEQSDVSVGLALEWLKSVQQRDGSWSFSEIGKSSQPGTLKSSPNGATAMALMAFLGAGHTHTEEGKYQETVDRGVNFLLNSYQRVPAGLDFRGKVESNEGMYVQGLVGIALSEAYGMSNDRRLRRAAEGALQFIMFAQDPKGGGWRYQPQQAGDTSVVGWELMALKSGYHAKIPIPRNIVAGVNKFLDSVAAEGGSKYGYSGPQPKASTTAIGLLCRMYLGWKTDNKALIAGVDYLDKTGPAKSDMYYNYYATQVMIQFTNARGDQWTKWNTAMRNQLVRTQRTDGPEKGSWNLADSHGARGGRLYMTCLAVMTLEVYYRVLPLYQRAAVDADL